MGGIDQHLPVFGIHLVINALPFAGGLVIILRANAFAFCTRLGIFCVVGNCNGNHVIKVCFVTKFKIICSDLYTVILIGFSRELSHLQRFISLKGMLPELDCNPVCRGRWALWRDCKFLGFCRIIPLSINKGTEIPYRALGIIRLLAQPWKNGCP
ncbi:hypothetical protein SDC9_111915 [bioreactor metagenome]|uniref:Uncharacterized protein n=1 Tax=bioreactor metagenome TaxID=1076179 RepID=A0A645BP74_9ZZZZ